MTRAEFSRKTMFAAFERTGGRCTRCGVKLQPGRTEYDHRIPCALGGTNEPDNCDPLCTACHRGAGGKTATDAANLAKAERVRAKHIGAVPKNPPGKWKRKVNGTVVLREDDAC